MTFDFHPAERNQVPKAYSYTRFSTPEQASGDSSRRQIELAEVYAVKHGLELDTGLRLRDEGVSGFRGANVRKGALGQFLQAIDDGLVPEGSFLLVESLDRVSRQNPWDALPVFQQIINAGITIATLFDGKTYEREDIRANPLLILQSLFVMVRANEESETKSRRLKSAWSNKRKRATDKPLTSIVPAWMKLEDGAIGIVKERGAVVRLIVDMTLSGSGQHRIAEALNRAEVPVFGKGSMWHRSYIKKIIENPALIGTLVPHELTHERGRRVRRAAAEVRGYFPALVSDEEWASLVALSSRRRPQQRIGGVKNILAGLAVCGSCGSSMVRVQKGSRSRPALVCSRAKAGAGCEYRSIPMSDVEFITRGGLSDMALDYPTGDEDVNDLAYKVRGAEAALSHIMDELEQHGGSAALTRSRLEREAHLAELESKLKDAVATSTVRSNVRPERLHELTDDASAEEINLVLRSLFKRVVVSHGGSFTFEPI